MSNPTHRRLLDFFAAYKRGEAIDRKTLMSTMNWSDSSLRTYLSKRKLEPFVRKQSDGRLVAIRDGDEINLRDITNAFKQVNDPVFVLYEGLEFRGGNGAYRLLTEIGSGAIGKVWKASGEFLGFKNEVAVKFLQPKMEFFEESKLNNIGTRFDRELKRGGQLNHDRIIRFLDSGKHAKVPFLVMEHGIRSAADLLEISGPLSISKTLEIVSSCVEGLQYLHDQSLIHRDIKPANILETPRGYVLGDLGIMQWSDFGAGFTSAGSLTKASIQLGSWYYMAPEQGEDAHNITGAVDVYALGITWYELLTATQPNPRAVSARRLDAPTDNEKVNTLIMQMTEYDSGDRPSPPELLTELNSI